MTALDVKNQNNNLIYCLNNSFIEKKNTQVLSTKFLINKLYSKRNDIKI